MDYFGAGYERAMGSGRSWSAGYQGEMGFIKATVWVMRGWRRTAMWFLTDEVGRRRTAV